MEAQYPAEHSGEKGQEKNQAGRSQHGRRGECRVRISAQLGHLPGTGGGPWTRTGGTSEQPGRTWWGSERGGEVEAGRDQCP